MPPSARDIAVRALRDRAGNVSAHLRRLSSQGAVSGVERALATELALGTVRRKPTLQAVLNAYLTSPGRRIKASVTNVLLVGLYQVLFLDRVPDFAAVNEAVSQARRLAGAKQAGFVNGVLRSVLRGLSPVSPGRGAAATDVIPLTPQTHRRADRRIFPDPGEAPVDYLLAAMAMPGPLAERWLSRLGSLEKVADLGYNANARAPLIARVNSLKTTVAGCVAALADEGVDARPHENRLSIVISHSTTAMTELAAFTGGLFQPQDPTASAVATAAGATAGMNVLDLCAAPGTKTTHLAELMSNRGSLVAADVSGEKLSQIESNCTRLGVTIVSTILAEQAGTLEPQSFDVVLADVPCTNTGVLARRAEARWRFSEKALSRLVSDQKAIAAAAALFVKPGGKLVYSTCSIEPEEGPPIVRWLCRQRRGLRIENEKMTLPGGTETPDRWHDGGYLAVLGA